MAHFKVKSKIKQAGFTLVELLVTITIFVMLTGVVLFSQERFNGTIFLSNLSYDIALTLRQAQTYGINIRGFVQGTNTSQFVPYGVHFDKADAAKSFILFADLDAQIIEGRVTSDGVFDVAPPYSIDPTTCDDRHGCVKRYVIQKGNYIKDLCATNSPSCESDDSVNVLDIVFVRPDPNAIITKNGNGNNTYNKAVITLSDASGDNSRQVIVQENGVVYVKKL